LVSRVYWSGPHIVMIEPGTNAPGKFLLDITAGASLTFPVLHRDGRAIKSFWGDSRDHGARLHQGVDIFAARGTPVVAAVDGAAFAAGLGLALACDRVVASTAAKFSASFTGVGLAADLGISWSLPRRVGAARAQQLLTLGGVLDADEALRVGLVDVVVEPQRVLSTAMVEARRFAEGPPRSLGLLKGHFADPPCDLASALDREVAIQTELMDTDDYTEGIAAFTEKRRPVFTGA
ncbi:MAG TPA: enoyl-CoA hydratase-related protein, partial [Micromonosporaceae bacterium]